MALKISIITPCLNMATFIEDTIKSVTSQNYPNLEYIILDGGSTDGTIKIINKYRAHITTFISEKDKGQYAAINKGLRLATGDIIAWLNADDIYFPWTLSLVSHIFETFSEINWLIGRFSFINENGHLTDIYENNGAKPQKYISHGWFRNDMYGFLQQESMFWRKELLETHGYLNENYKLAADFELWTRFAKNNQLVALDLPIAAFRKRQDSRSRAKEDLYLREVKEIISSMPSPASARQWIGSKSLILNHVQRMLTFQKSPLCYYSIKDCIWKLKTNKRSISNNTLRHYLKIYNS